MANVYNTGMQSYTGARGNTIYYGAAGAENGTRGIAGGYVAVDRGSDGSIDAAAAGAVGKGPNGAAAWGAAVGARGAVGAAGAVNANGELAGLWAGYRGV